MFCINLFCENQTVFEYHLNKSPRRKQRLNDKIQTQKILYYWISIMKFRDYSKRGKRKKTQQLLYLSTRTWIAQHKTFIWAYICAQTYKLTANKLKRTHFHEVLRTAQIKLFPLLCCSQPILHLHYSLHEQNWLSLSSNGLLYTRKYFHFNTIDFYVGL